MNDEELVPMHPWWRGFKGEVKELSKGKYEVCGIARKVDDSTVEVTKLPIHMWMRKFKEQLEGMIVSEKGEAQIKVSLVLLLSAFISDTV